MESFVAALVKDTTKDLATWARQLWEGQSPDIAPLTTRLEATMFLALLNEIAGSSGPPLHQYDQNAPTSATPPLTPCQLWAASAKPSSNTPSRPSSPNPRSSLR